MSDVFTQTPDFTPYSAIVPGSLCNLPEGSTLVPACNDPSVAKTTAIRSLHDGKWWAQKPRASIFS
jgi:DNA-binding beta-propeller fold protein YncE